MAFGSKGVQAICQDVAHEFNVLDHLEKTRLHSTVSNIDRCSYHGA